MLFKDDYPTSPPKCELTLFIMYNNCSNNNSSHYSSGRQRELCSSLLVFILFGGGVNVLFHFLTSGTPDVIRELVDLIGHPNHWFKLNVEMIIFDSKLPW